MNRQIDKKKVMQVLIDAGWHRQIKLAAAKLERTVKSLTEEGLSMVVEAYKDELEEK